MAPHVSSKFAVFFTRENIYIYILGCYPRRHTELSYPVTTSFRIRTHLCLIMKFSASILALAACVIATPTPEELVPLEGRQSLPSVNFRSYTSLGCPGSGSAGNARVNACVALPGASTKLQTVPGICVG